MHDFTAKTQLSYLYYSKERLLDGEFICIVDFSENYTIVQQNEVHAAHWNSQQVTIFPIVAYYLSSDT